MIKIEDIPMFSDLDKKFHKELQDSIHIKKFTKNSIVFYEGDESDYLYILLDGYNSTLQNISKRFTGSDKAYESTQCYRGVCLF